MQGINPIAPTVQAHHRQQRKRPRKLKPLSQRFLHQNPSLVKLNPLLGKLSLKLPDLALHNRALKTPLHPPLPSEIRLHRLDRMLLILNHLLRVLDA